MYLSKIKIENVRGFLGGDAASEVAIPRAPGWYVFAGRNGSGKSTLLKATALAIAGPEFSRHLVPSFASWVRHGEARAVVSVELGKDASDHLVGTGAPPKNTTAATLEWKAEGEGPEPSFRGIPGRQGKLAGPWRGPWSPNPKGWLVVGYGPFRRLTGHAAEAQRAMVGQHHIRRLVSLFYEDASLQEVIEWLKNEQLRVLEKREGAKELLDGVKELLNDKLLPDDAVIDRVDSEGLWVRRGKTEVELRELSDGYRVALALVLDLVRHMHDAYGKVSFGTEEGQVVVRNPGVVLVDEVDAHLHVSWQQAIGDWLQVRFPRVQFLVTTHSPFVCQSASANGLFRLPAPGERHGIKAVDDKTFRAVVNGSVDDAVLSKLFGMERSESARAARMKTEWSRLEAQRLRSGKLSKHESERWETLRRQLPLPFEQPAAE